MAQTITVKDMADLEELKTGSHVAPHDGSTLQFCAKEEALTTPGTEALRMILPEAEGQPRLQLELPSASTTATPGSSCSGASSPTSWPVREGPASGEPRRLIRGSSRPLQRRSTDEPQRSRVVHQGSLLLQRQRHQEGQVAARPEVHHVVVFEDRFEYYADRASMASGASPQGTVRVADVQQVRVQDAGFVLGLGSEGLNLRIPTGQVPRALPLRIGVVSARGLRSTECCPYCVCEVQGEPKLRTGVVVGGLRPVWNHEATVQGCGEGDALVFELFHRDFERSDELLGRATLESRRFLPSGFEGELPLERGGNGTEVSLRVRVSPAEAAADQPDMKTWVNALRTVFDPDRLLRGADAGAGTAAGAPPGSGASPGGAAVSGARPPPAEGEAAEAPRQPVNVRRAGSLWSKTDRLPEKPLSELELLQEAGDPRVAAWLASLRERPRHSGTLGFQRRGRMVTRYAVMFEDRLDVWEGALAAASGRRASERIWLHAVRGVEAVFGGFIINCGGKRIGIHVRSNEDLHAWSAALLEVIAQPGPQAAPASCAASAAGSLRSHSTGASTSLEPPPDRKKQRPRSVGWVPRVATLGQKEGSGGSAGPRKTYFTVRSQGKCFSINTHKAAQAGTSLHGKHAKVMPHSGDPGGRHLSQGVAGKVNECAKSPRTARLVALDNSIADKVTGSSPACSPRREPGSLTWTKVQHAEATPPPNTSRSTMEPRSPLAPPYAVVDPPASARTPRLQRSGSMPVTGKVNGAPWGGPSGRQRQQPCHDMGKITDPGREGTGWAQPVRPASVDKARGLGSKRLAGMTLK